MLSEKLIKACWQQTCKKAQLVLGDQVLLEMEFYPAGARVQIGRRVLRMSKKRIWSSELFVEEKGRILGLQKKAGCWKSASHILINGRPYKARTQIGSYRAGYYDAEGNEILQYRLVAFQWKTGITFSIMHAAVPEEDLLLLVLIGFYAARGVLLECASVTSVPAAR